MTILSIFDSKLRLTKYVQSSIFQRFYKEIENFILLGGTKVFNLKNHERITHVLYSYRSDKQFYGGSASEALAVDVMKMDALARQKNQKRHFLKDISKSFQEVTPMGPEPHQFFSFSNISTNMVARGIQSFGRNGSWLAG